MSLFLEAIFGWSCFTNDRDLYTITTFSLGKNYCVFKKIAVIKKMLFSS